MDSYFPRPGLAAAALVCMSLLTSLAAAGGEYYVAPNGSNATGDGSLDKPWGTLNHAANQVPDDGSTIVMRDGVYVGAQSVSRHFSETLHVRAETPYRAEIVSNPGSTRAFNIYNASNLNFSGLNIYGSSGTGSEYVMHLSTINTHHITFENSLIHNSYNNDVIKINDRAHNITFRGNMTYNANAGGDEHFDINTVRDIVLEDNIFLNDFEGSDRPQQNNTHPFIVVKNSSNTHPDYTQNITIRRNIFSNWSGLNDQSYILIGEDGKDFWEAQTVVVENNLLLFNSPNSQVGAFMVKGGARDVTFRANTVNGSPVDASAYAMRLVREGANPPMENIAFLNNIFSDPTGRMNDFSDGFPEDVINGQLLNNLYWNDGKPVPGDHDWGGQWDTFDPHTGDPEGIFVNPMLTDPTRLLIPRWDSETGRFISGYETLREEFERLVFAYASFPKESPIIGSADLTEMPEDDILGRQRTAMDIGALEQLPFMPGDITRSYRIDEEDLAILMANWGSSDAQWTDGDFTGDGTVGDEDLALLLMNWSPKGYLLPGYLERLAVPEPATAALLLAGGLVLLGHRERRCGREG